MTWTLLASALLTVLVGAVVLPRRAGHERVGFPWFWVTFPVSVFAWVCTIGVFLSRYAHVMTSETDRVGLSLPYPEFGQTVQFLSNEQSRQMYGPIEPTAYLFFFPVLGVVCTLVSVIAWRKGRM
ncbi:MAG: hypothetical protein ACI38U_08475 [Corynebacterium sp.]|uniref:hypothetical protein n=1 Tax=unclassified Corynebacterium TaxID=2624378 RepID=UPI0011154014|nr:hypothetical protein [Corynebacterium sp. CNJ-954]